MSFIELLRSGGPVLLVIILTSFYTVYLFVQRLFKINADSMDSDALMLRVNTAVRERDLEAALAACETEGGPVSRVLKSALLKLPYGRAAVEAASQEAYLIEEQQLSKGIRPLSAIAQIATLLGLLGTVTGIIIAFSVVSQQGMGDPGALAGGIGQALVNTAAGLIVAIMAIIGQNYLSSRAEEILLDMERRREELMANVAQAVATKRDANGREAREDDYETAKAS
jgi:biopolymer transport protein ExbB